MLWKRTCLCFCRKLELKKQPELESASQHWFVILGLLNNSPLLRTKRPESKQPMRSFHFSQVWSLTQFYTLGCLQSKISLTKVCFSPHMNKVCVNHFQLCPWTFAPSATYLTRGPCIFEVQAAIHEARLGTFEGRHVCSKGLQGSETKTRELLEGINQNKYPPWWGVMADLGSHTFSKRFTS